MTTPISSLHDLISTVRARRGELGLSQAELARRAGVSRLWVNEFEAGKPTAELGLALRLLEALDLRLSVDSRDDGAAGPVPGSDAIDLDALLEGFARR